MADDERAKPPDRPKPPERVEVPEEQEFWRAVDDGELALVQCSACGAWSGFARSCVGCGSRDYTWQVASARGTIRSFAVFHRGYHRYFEGELPYAVAVVGLDEGPDLVTNVVDCGLDDITVGMPVRIVTRRRGESMIPQAVPIDVP